MNELSEDHAEVQVYTNALRISQICAELRHLLQRADSNGLAPEMIPEIEAAIQHLRDCDYYTEYWFETAPSRWRPRHTLQTSSGGAGQAYFYHDITVAITHYYHRSFRIHMHEMLVQTLELLSTAGMSYISSDDIEIAIDHSRRAGRELIDGNICTVPFLTGRVDCYGVRSPVIRGLWNWAFFMLALR